MPAQTRRNLLNSARIDEVEKDFLTEQPSLITDHTLSHPFKKVHATVAPRPWSALRELKNPSVNAVFGNEQIALRTESHAVRCIDNAGFPRAGSILLVPDSAGFGFAPSPGDHLVFLVKNRDPPLEFPDREVIALHHRRCGQQQSSRDLAQHFAFQ